MKTLAAPSRGLSLRILSEVGYEQRFTAYRLSEKAGATPLTMYCFEELLVLMATPYPLVDLPKLESWIRDVMKDGALADRIREVILEEIPETGKTARIGELMAERLQGVIGYCRSNDLFSS